MSNPVERHPYFAYGSNMCADQMADRLGPVEFSATCRLAGHALVFNRKVAIRTGGVASIEPRPGAFVYGGVWMLTPEQFETMDAIEDPEHYERIEIGVELLGDAPQFKRVHTYRAFPQGDFRPSLAYLEIIKRGADRLGLPASYRAMLETIESV